MIEIKDGINEFLRNLGGGFTKIENTYTKGNEKYIFEIGTHLYNTKVKCILYHPVYGSIIRSTSVSASNYTSLELYKKLGKIHDTLIKLGFKLEVLPNLFSQSKIVYRTVNKKIVLDGDDISTWVRNEYKIWYKHRSYIPDTAIILDFAREVKKVDLATFDRLKAKSFSDKLYRHECDINIHNHYEVMSCLRYVTYKGVVRIDDKCYLEYNIEKPDEKDLWFLFKCNTFDFNDENVIYHPPDSYFMVIDSGKRQRIDFNSKISLTTLDKAFLDSTLAQELGGKKDA